MKNQYNLNCNIAQTLNIIGDKWSLLILHEIKKGHKTFKEIEDNLQGIPTNLLSSRLKNLEEDELIKSQLYQKHPPRYEYVLTESGSDLEDIFNSLIMWGEKHLHKCYKRLVHKKCESKVEHQYYCPTCDSVVSKNEIGVKPMEDK
ncbi:helix-turn-helix domain-containing protein [Hathewaya histolytica]|uniref:Transcriptional regulator, MarR family n=1 Tax=Hathewaya histolytica TaxID=1498 RepID=A0A4U9RBY8_HATHI|nr:helix-turn-helix domain-containing protein [Hathewaya histolytica]VTQ89079.1 transcriptional regulator, MarR family [Hathewaya histolytica]